MKIFIVTSICWLLLQYQGLVTRQTKDPYAVRFTQFSDYKKGQKQIGLIIATTRARTLVECAQSCNRHANCLAVNFCGAGIREV